MRYFNKEEIERLKQAEPYFTTAVKLKYKRNTTKTLNNLICDVYEEAGGNKLSRNWTCGQCTYNAYRTVGQWYFKSIEKLAKENEVQPELEPYTDSQEVTENESQIITSKKRGRPKKTD